MGVWVGWWVNGWVGGRTYLCDKRNQTTRVEIWVWLHYCREKKHATPELRVYLQHPPTPLQAFATVTYVEGQRDQAQHPCLRKITALRPSHTLQKFPKKQKEKKRNRRNPPRSRSMAIQSHVLEALPHTANSMPSYLFLRKPRL